MLFFLFLQQASSLSINSIPSTSSPPNARIGSCAIYDAKTDRIFITGGQQLSNDLVTSEVSIFDLKTMKWITPEIISNFEPAYLVNHGMHMRADRNIFVYSRFSEVFLFNIDQYSWRKEEISGDLLYGIKAFGYTSVVLNENEYFVIFGGIDPYGYSNRLYLIDVNNLVSKLLPNNGTPPSPRIAPSIVFYNNSFYVYGYSNYQFAAGLETGNELYRYDLSGEYWEIVETFGMPPGPMINQYYCVYKEEMYIAYGIMPEFTYQHDSIVKFSFKTKTWTYVSNIPNAGTFQAATVLISNKLYLIFGRTKFDYKNSISYINLDHPEAMPTIVSENWISPSKRVFHCSFVVNLNLYIFGGSNGINSDAEEYYNDMWTFNFEDQVWSTVNAFGDMPTARKNFAICKISGEVIAIYGGKGYNGFLSDFYYFHEPLQKWYSIEPDNGLPSKRSNSCMVFHNNLIYIIGGKNDEGGFNEIWIYDFVTNLISLSGVQIGGTVDFVIKNINDATCWIETEKNYFKIQIVGGADSTGYPNTNLITVYFYNNNTQEIKMSPLGDITKQAIVGLETAVMLYNKTALRFGGSMFNWMIFTNIVAYDLDTGSYKLFDTRFDFDFYGHTAVHFKKSIYVFGGGTSIEIYKSYYNFSSNLLKIDFELKDEVELGCSAGTYGENCDPCPAGTYSSNNTCIKCPPGRYTTKLASTSIEQCMPCPSGKFSNTEGSNRCRDCEFGYLCPIGSITPKKQIDLLSNSSIQPVPYKDHKSEISKITQKLWYGLSGMCAFTCIICVLFHMVWTNIQKLDFFVGNHNNGLNVPIINRKTRFGGLFSVIFLLVSSVSLVSAFLSFYLDNVYEIQALIPAISLSDEIFTSFLQINSTFYSYGGVCGLDGKCIDQVYYSDIGIQYRSRNISCFVISENCHVVVNYDSAMISSKEAEGFFSLEESSSYATGISLNVTTASSLPGQISNVFVRITTSSNDKLLKGTSPSIFYYKFTPSVRIIQLFTSESSTWPAKETGYHIWTDQEPVIGSQAVQETLNLRLHLKLKILISKSYTAMQTQRRLNQTWLIFIGTLLGSIFGLMGTFAALMNFTENLNERVQNKLTIKKKINKLAIKRNMLINQFEIDDYVKPKGKVTPAIYEVNETAMGK